VHILELDPLCCPGCSVPISKLDAKAKVDLLDNGSLGVVCTFEFLQHDKKDDFDYRTRTSTCAEMGDAMVWAVACTGHRDSLSYKR